MGFNPTKHCKIIEKNGKKDLIFLHGFSTNRHMVEILGEGYRNIPDYNLIFCDARGHGSRSNDGKKTDWMGTVEDYDELINQRNHDTVLIGGSMGGTIALTLGLKNPQVKQVFAISSVNGKKIFFDKKQVAYYENRYHIPFDASMDHEIREALPYNYETCNPQNKDKFFLIHAETDTLVPFDELKQNQHDLCLPEENILIYSKKQIPALGTVITHALPSYLPQTHTFIKKHLKK